MVVSLVPVTAFADGPYLATNNVTAQVQGDHGKAKVEINSTEVTEAAKDASVVFTATPNPGYEFDHWEVVSGGVNIEATQNPITVTMPGEALTLKAYYAPITYKVEFDENGGTGNMASQTMTYDVAAKLNPNVFTAPDGKQFAGWVESPTADEPTYADGELVKNLAATEGAEITLYAVWREASEYTVVFYLLDEGSDGAGTVSKKVDIWRPSHTEENPQGSTATANEGYFFKGWKNAEGNFITEDEHSTDVNLSSDGKKITPTQTSTKDTYYTAVFLPLGTVSGVSMNKTDFAYGDAVGYTGTPVAKTIEGVDVTESIEDWVYFYSQNNGTAEEPQWAELSNAPTALGSYKLVVRAYDKENDYQGKLELPFTIGKRAVTVSGIAVQDKTYNGKTDDAVIVLDDVSFTGKLDADNLTISGITGTYASANASDTQTVNLNASSAWTLGGESAAHYMLATEGQPTSVTGKISKVTPTLASVSATAITYGQTLADSTVTGTATDENKTSDKTVEGTFAFTTGDTTPAVSDSENTTYGVTFTPTDGTNYNTSTTEIKLKVNKADYAEVIKTASGNLKAKKDSTAEITLPSIPENASYGTVTNNNTALYTINETNKASGKLTLTAAKDFNQATESGDTTFTVAVEPDGNHNGYDITVTVTPTFKEPVSIIAEADGFTYGDSGKTGYKNVTVQDSLVDVNTLAATYYLADGTTKTNTTEGASAEGGLPTKAGTYKVTLAVPESNANYYGSKTVEFTISKKAITIKPNDKSAYVGDTKPELGADDYTVTGLVNGDTLSTAPNLSYETEPDMTKAGTTAIKAIGANAGTNYAISYEDGTLTVSNRPSSGGGSTPTVTVPVSGDGSSVKVEASVSGSTAAVKDIKDADLAKVVDAKAVEIDLSGLNKNVDTAKIPTTTVEKIGEQTGMSVKLSTATVTFDQTATQEISDQAKGNTVELVVDDVKEVSLNAVQKEAVKKLDTALIIDAHLVSNGARLCSESKGGFGGGKATVVLPYEIKNNRAPANYSVFYVDDNGKLQKLNAVYDKELAAFVFEIEHFSVYAVAYDENGMSFADVPETAYYYNAVLWAAENGITQGTDDVHFSPNAPVTRAQVVTFLWRAAGKPVVNYYMNISDVKSGEYYSEAVRWALSEGITKGTSDTTFSPDKVCTRGQIVTFLARFAGVKDEVTGYTHDFTDVKAADYFNNAVAWAKDNKVTEGTSATTFSPHVDCTRAQVVTFLWRWMVK